MNQASSQKELILTKTKRLLRRKNGKNDTNQVSERKRKWPRQVRRSGDSHSQQNSRHTSFKAAPDRLTTVGASNHGYINILSDRWFIFNLGHNVGPNVMLVM